MPGRQGWKKIGYGTPVAPCGCPVNSRHVGLQLRAYQANFAESATCRYLSRQSHGAAYGSPVSIFFPQGLAFLEEKIVLKGLQLELVPHGGVTNHHSSRLHDSDK
jgi:hypothetical protein